MTRRTDFGTWSFGLRDASKLDDRQMLALAEMLDDELESVAARHTYVGSQKLGTPVSQNHSPLDPFLA